MEQTPRPTTSSFSCLFSFSHLCHPWVQRTNVGAISEPGLPHPPLASRSLDYSPRTRSWAFPREPWGPPCWHPSCGSRTFSASRDTNNKDTNNRSWSVLTAWRSKRNWREPLPTHSSSSYAWNVAVEGFWRELWSILLVPATLACPRAYLCCTYEGTSL